MTSVASALIKVFWMLLIKLLYAIKFVWNEGIILVCHGENILNIHSIQHSVICVLFIYSSILRWILKMNYYVYIIKHLPWVGDVAQTWEN